MYGNPSSHGSQERLREADVAADSVAYTKEQTIQLQERGRDRLTLTGLWWQHCLTAFLTAFLTASTDCLTALPMQEQKMRALSEKLRRTGEANSSAGRELEAAHGRCAPAPDPGTSGGGPPRSRARTRSSDL